MRKERNRKKEVEIKTVKYIHQEDYENIAGKGEYRENIDILLYFWRRSRVRRGKCMDLHTLGIYLRFGRFSVRF